MYEFENDLVLSYDFTNLSGVTAKFIDKMMSEVAEATYGTRTANKAVNSNVQAFGGEIQINPVEMFTSNFHYEVKVIAA